MPTRPEPKEIAFHILASWRRSTHPCTEHCLPHSLLLLQRRLTPIQNMVWQQWWHPFTTRWKDPFILDNIQPSKSSNFIWVFYNPTHSLYNTKFHCQWFGILKVAELYTFWSVTKLVFWELSNLIDNMDTDTDPDTDSVTSQTSQSTKYYTTSEGALPWPPAPTSLTLIIPMAWIVIDSHILHETKWYISFEDKEWSQGLHG